MESGIFSRQNGVPAEYAVSYGIRARDEFTFRSLDPAFEGIGTVSDNLFFRDHSKIPLIPTLLKGEISNMGYNRTSILEESIEFCRFL